MSKVVPREIDSTKSSSIVKMNSPPFLIDCLINVSFFVKAMIDTGYLFLAVLDECLVRNHVLKCEEIKPRSLRLAESKVAASITKIPYIDMEIDSRDEKVCGYVCKGLKVVFYSNYTQSEI